MHLRASRDLLPRPPTAYASATRSALWSHLRVDLARFSYTNLNLSIALAPRCIHDETT